MTTGEFIRNRRIQLGLSQTDIAIACNVSRSAVCKWEKGDIKNAKRDKIEALAKVLRIDPMEITRVEISGIPFISSDKSDESLNHDLAVKLSSLSPAEFDRVMAYIDGMIAARSE